MPRPNEVEAILLDIDGIETVQVSIGSSGSALRDAFTGGGSGITYSITTDPDVDQVALREEVQAAVVRARRRRHDHRRRRRWRLRLERHRDRRHRARLRDPAGGDGRRRRPRSPAPTGIGPGLEQPLGIPPLHRRGRRRRQGRVARALRGRGRSARVEHDAAAADRHGRDRRHVAHGVPRGIADSGDARRAAAADRPQRDGPDPARGGRHGRGERRPHLDHDRGRPAHRDGHRHAVHRRPDGRLRVGQHSAGRRRPAGLRGCRRSAA